MHAKDDDDTGTAHQLWLEPSTAEFWRYWQYGWDHLVRRVTGLLLREAGIAPGMTVLDVGSGHGEPALTLGVWVGVDGQVVATDVSAPMIAIAVEQAAIAGLSNIVFTVADIVGLPFADATFDVSVGRFSLMYVSDPSRACAEVRRALKPGGRFACAVWGAAEDVPWYARAVGVLARYVDIPPHDPHAPGPFRFSVPGSLASALEDGGFTDVAEGTHEVSLAWPGGLASFVTFIEGLHCGLIAQVPVESHPQIRNELRAAFRDADASESARWPATVIVASGTTPVGG